MYRKQHNGQLSIEEYNIPFGGTLDPDNRWVVFSSLMPWEELEDTYDRQFNRSTGSPCTHLILVRRIAKDKLTLVGIEEHFPA
jgi:hypothetical protein